jgi:dienelactone hydrolase
VYIPDFFNGQPLNPTDPDLPTKIPLFRQNNPAPAASKHVKIVVDHLLQQSPPIKSLSFIGFCYGAKPITVLLQSNPYIHSKTNVVVFNHPSSLTKEEADQWNKIPLHINEAETDQIFVPELRAHWERVLTEKKLGSFKLYPVCDSHYLDTPSSYRYH